MGQEIIPLTSNRTPSSWATVWSKNLVQNIGSAYRDLFRTEFHWIISGQTLGESEDSLNGKKTQL